MAIKSSLSKETGSVEKRINDSLVPNILGCSIGCVAIMGGNQSGRRSPFDASGDGEYYTLVF